MIREIKIRNFELYLGNRKQTGRGRQVLPLTRFSDHAPISAKIYTKSSTSSIRIRNYAFTEPGIVTFCTLWQSYTFFNYPSADTVTDFYHHLHVSVKQSSRSVTRKRASLPTYYSSHTVHTLNKQANSKRKYHSGNYVVRNFEDTLEKSLELDNVLYISGKVTSNLDSCFELIESFKDKSLPIQCFPLHRNSVLGLTLQMLSMIYLLQISTRTRTKQGYQMTAKVFFNVFCSFSDSDILQVILNSTACTYETHDDFTNGLLKKCSGLFATLFRIVFNCVILNCQFPEIWRSSIIKLIHKGACRNYTTNYSPNILLPKISLIFEKLLHKFLIDLLKNKNYPRQYGFQSKKSTIC